MNNLNVIYEDNHIIVVEKPYNIPSQEDSSKDIDMINIIKNYLKEKYQKKGNVYLGLIHRLDRPVGGLMVFAKTSKAASRLSSEVRNNEFHKTYLAVVNGKTKEKEKLIDYISKDNKTFSSYIDNENGKESILEYETLYYDKKEDVSLIKVNLITGRHHQIRLQMSNINHPLIGDQRYGKEDKKQIMLYAYKIRFVHPTKKEVMTFELLPKWDIIKEVNL
ncbi:MAG: RluA family pseudouridine synthase [Bacilli bacterium]|nr:RluA family pseudouridine synthase [Bacilli bacterium]